MCHVPVHCSPPPDRVGTGVYRDFGSVRHPLESHPPAGRPGDGALTETEGKCGDKFDGTGQ